MRILKTTSALLYAMILALVPAGSAAQPRAQFSIGFVSVQRVLTESDDAKAAAKEIETLRAARQQELAAKKQALDATRLEAANSGGWFSRSRLTELTTRARQEEAELQRATQQAQVDLQETQKKVQERLRTDVNDVLTKLARERGLAYVLNQDAAIVLAPSGANLTDEVLSRMNAAFAAKQAATTAPPTAATKAP